MISYYRVSIISMSTVKKSMNRCFGKCDRVHLHVSQSQFVILIKLKCYKGKSGSVNKYFIILEISMSDCPDYLYVIVVNLLSFVKETFLNVL